MSPETPLDATGIARRHFPTVRRGYEPAEVRAFLHELADLVGRLQRSEAHERERAQRAESRAELAEDLDQHRLVELLGEETARVLDAARDAARDIRTKAEEAAARMVREAQETGRGIVEQAEQDAAVRKLEILADAAELRREAEVEVERCRVEGRALLDEMRAEANAEREHMIAQGERARSEAEADAEALRATARDQGQALVSEAQAVREHMLGDLARRRRTAREQLERLSAARDRLLNAYGVVRRTLDEATTELDVVLPEAKAAAELAVRRVHDEPPSRSRPS
jgi:DivIVA domain-containing protein